MENKLSYEKTVEKYQHELVWIGFCVYKHLWVGNFEGVKSKCVGLPKYNPDLAEKIIPKAEEYSEFLYVCN